MKIWHIGYESTDVCNNKTHRWEQRKIRGIKISYYKVKFEMGKYVSVSSQSDAWEIKPYELDKYKYGKGIYSLDKETALNLMLKYIEREKDPAINNKSNIKSLKSHLKSIEMENKNEE